MDDEQLADALAQAVDEDGNDLRLAEATARMTAEDRAASEANVRAWVSRAPTYPNPRPQATAPPLQYAIAPPHQQKRGPIPSRTDPLRLGPLTVAYPSVGARSAAS